MNPACVSTASIGTSGCSTAQVLNAAQTTVVQAAWDRGQALAIHGWVYGLSDGLVRHLGISLTSQDELSQAMKTSWEKKSASLYKS